MLSFPFAIVNPSHSGHARDEGGEGDETETGQPTRRASGPRRRHTDGRPDSDEGTNGARGLQAAGRADGRFNQKAGERTRPFSRFFRYECSSKLATGTLCF